MFKEGARIQIIGVISGWGNEMTGRIGTIMYRDPDSDESFWYVKIDGHPGFDEQDGCWILNEDCMKVIEIKNNSSATILLDKEY
jgi:hypothetical protein